MLLLLSPYDRYKCNKFKNDLLFNIFYNNIGGMILGWLGAIESFLVVILTTIGLSHVPQIMHHLRNETMGVHLETVNETHVSIFRRHRGEMSEADEMFIERGDM